MYHHLAQTGSSDRRLRINAPLVLFIYLSCLQTIGRALRHILTLDLTALAPHEIPAKSPTLHRFPPHYRRQYLCLRALSRKKLRRQINLSIIQFHQFHPEGVVPSAVGATGPNPPRKSQFLAQSGESPRLQDTPSVLSPALVVADVLHQLTHITQSLLQLRLT